jgi:hypothetical protein
MSKAEQQWQVQGSIQFGVRNNALKVKTAYWRPNPTRFSKKDGLLRDKAAEFLSKRY